MNKCTFSLSLILLASCVGTSTSHAFDINQTLSSFFTCPFYTLFGQASLEEMQDRVNSLSQDFHEINTSFSNQYIQGILNYNKAFRKREKKAAQPFSTAFADQEKAELENRLSYSKEQPFLFFEKEITNACNELRSIKSICQSRAKLDTPEAAQYQALLDDAIQLKKTLKKTHTCLMYTPEYNEELEYGQGKMILIALGIIAATYYIYTYTTSDAAVEPTTPETIPLDSLLPQKDAEELMDIVTYAGTTTSAGPNIPDVIKSKALSIWDTIQAIDTNKMVENALNDIGSF